MQSQPSNAKRMKQNAKHAATQQDHEDLGPKPTENEAETKLSRVLAPLDALGESPPFEEVEVGLRAVASMVGGSDRLERAIVRQAAVKRLEHLNVSSPARLVDAALEREADVGDGKHRQGQSIILSDPDPWPEPVGGTQLLEDLERALTRHLVLPEGASTAIALWTVNAHAHEASEIAPYLGVTSPVKRCGKTTLFQVLSVLVPRPLFTSNITPAAVFRSVEAFEPTLLIDEADTFLALSDEMRGILNAGHSRVTAYVVRTVGDEHEPRRFSTWCPKAIGLIGKLPSTLEDRSIEIRMRRRAKTEQVERFREKKLVALKPLGRRAARWATDNLAELRAADPEVPEELDDRAADNWRPLIAIADLAGGEWPKRARDAARLLSGGERRADTSAGIQLLAAIRDVFESSQRDRLPSSKIAEQLTEREDRPWAAWKQGRPITAHQIAQILKPFEIGPKGIRVGAKTLRGYERAQFEDAFERYLPSNPQQPQHPNNDDTLDSDSNPLHREHVAIHELGLTADGDEGVAAVAIQSQESAVLEVEEGLI